MLHKSVLLEEVLSYLDLGPDKNYIDATVGAGGHTLRILEKTAPKGLVIGFERDEMTSRVARDRLRIYGERFRLIEENFENVEKALEKAEGRKFSGVLWDLGVSSMQIDDSSRGFSFLREGPIDMRMDKRSELTAQTVVNEFSEQELSSIFFRFGEERFARSMARNIVKERSNKIISTTKELSEIISKSVPAKFRKKGLHPATKAFMALRIFVNSELESIERSLKNSLKVLEKGSRLVAISFHSLEDRIVKNFFRDAARRCSCPRGLPECICGGQAKLKILTKRPITSSELEISENPRARSSKLRVAEVL